MREVFVDTLYWVALVRPDDPWQEAARRATTTLGDAHLVTSQEVLSESLNALRTPEHVRALGAQLVRRLQEDPGITVLAQSAESFEDGVALFENRPDKAYSHVDCVSMAAMRERGMTEVLTNDHHFTQEGFEILIKET